jgi:hypothetical protein
MDTRYRERRYSAKLIEQDYGAFLQISRNGVIVGEVAVGIFSGGRDMPVQVAIKRFRPNELREVQILDALEGE